MAGIVFAIAVALRVSSVGSQNAGEKRDREAVVTSDQSESVTSLAPNATAATGSIVEIDTTQVAASTPSNNSTRDQRYQELLRNAPPTSPSQVQIPTPPPGSGEKPTIMQRIAGALGLGSEKKTGTPPAAPAPPRPSQQQASSQQQPQRPSQSEQPKSNEPQKPVEERDPESDTVPPQLIGLQFNPPQVQDGETTVLTITAQDDLSGIRTISGVIANPTGATVSGFAAQLEPESQRYVARITVPKDAAEGNWHIKYLTMSDKASNQVNLAYGQNLQPAWATFRVTSSRSDSKGPELKALWIDKRSMAAGEKNTIFATVEDDKAGVQIVSGVFVSPAKQARLGFGCRAGSTGAWECTLNVPECVDCGVWQLEQIQMQDKANNTTTARVDNQLVHAIQVDVSGDRCDGAAPVLTGLALNPPVVSNQQPNVITVTASVQDDNCGGATLSGLATGPQGQRLNIIFEPSKDGQTFNGRIDVAQNQAKGTYTIAWIQALDKGQNLRAYSATDPVVARVNFRVE